MKKYTVIFKLSKNLFYGIVGVLANSRDTAIANAAKGIDKDYEILSVEVEEV